MITSRPAAGGNAVRIENQRPGSAAWLPQSVRFTPTGLRGRFVAGGGDRVTWLDSGRGRAIEGWCSASSVRAGETLTVHVGAEPAGAFTLDVFRMGYYGGLGARLVASYGPLPGGPQPDPEPRAARLIECDWAPSLAIEIPADWLSGVYLGKLTRADDGIESYVIFVVRDDREADLLAQTSEFTWQAYNRWPDAYSLYSDGADDLTAYYGTDVAVGFDRPYLSTTYFNSPLPGTGEYFVFEYPFTYWLEKSGYDVTYCSNLDTHRGTAAFTRTRGFLGIGHDEYVTRAMYDNLIAARDAGVGLGFFAGNSYCFEVDLRAGARAADRVFSRADVFGPDRSPESGYVPQLGEEEYAGTFPFPLRAPDEGLLIGARNHWPIEGVGDWVCRLPEHWIFAGTGMRAGDAIPNLVGHEWHGNPAVQIPGLEVVAGGATWDAALGEGEYAATVYPGPHGNVVFNAATCWWGSGLAHPPGFQRSTWHDMPSGLPDGRVQRITRNVLDRMIGRDPA